MLPPGWLISCVCILMSINEMTALVITAVTSVTLLPLTTMCKDSAEALGPKKILPSYTFHVDSNSLQSSFSELCILEKEKKNIPLF